VRVAKTAPLTAASAEISQEVKMKIVKVIGVVLAVLLLSCAAFLWYMGFFSALTVNEQELGPYTYVYERFVGPYMNVGPIFKKVEAALRTEGITADKAIGIYYDDPAKVAKEKLRSDCGLVLKESDLSKVQALKKKYTVGTLPKKMSMVVEFPMKNTLSYLLGPIRCYPVLMKYAQEKGYKAGVTYELYLKEKTLFVMEIVK
jgi:hypothetical protein